MLARFPDSTSFGNSGKACPVVSPPVAGASWAKTGEAPKTTAPMTTDAAPTVNFLIPKRCFRSKSLCVIYFLPFSTKIKRFLFCLKILVPRTLSKKETVLLMGFSHSFHLNFCCVFLLYILKQATILLLSN